VLGVPCPFTVALSARRKARADQARKLVPTTAWNRASCGQGRKETGATRGPGSPPPARGTTCSSAETSKTPPIRPTSTATFPRAAGSRWAPWSRSRACAGPWKREDFQVGKDQFGLDHSQVRLHTALMRHLVLTMTALAICAITAAAMRDATSTLPPAPTSPDDEPPEDPGLIPLTVAEVKRLLNLLTRTRHGPTRHLH